MDSSDPPHVEILSDHDNSEGNNSKDNSGDFSRESSEDSSQDYSYSPTISSYKEFGPENSQPIPDEDGFSMDKSAMAWVPTFKERVGKTISRLLNDSMKFCASGKMNAPPIICISLLKVRGEF